MATDTKLIVRIITDAKEAAAGVQKAKGEFSGFNDTMKGLVAPAGVALGAITALGAAALGSASELEQSAGSIKAVFGDASGEVEKFAQSAATSVGLATSEYQGFAATIGAQLKNLGVPMDSVVDNTNELITLGADLAATYGGTTQQAVEALSSALRGEADPAERYGLALNQTAVNAELAAQGLTGLEGEAATAAKAQAIMALATEQAGGAIGQFGRESDTVAGQQQRLNAQWEDAQAALGQGLLPIMTPVIAALAEFATFVQQNAQWIVPLVAIIGVLAAAVIAYTVAQWALNVALTANPIGILITIIGALIIAIVAVIASNEELRQVFIDVWNNIMSFLGTVWDWIVNAWEMVVGKFQTGLEQIGAFFQSIFDGVRSIVENVSAFFRSAWESAINFVVQIISGIMRVYQTVFNGIRSAVQSVANFFRSAWTNAVNAVRSVLTTLGNIAASVFNGIKNAISGVVGFFNNIVAAVRNVINWISRIRIPDLGGLFRASSQSAQLAPAASSFQAFSGRGLAVATPTAAAMGGGGGTVINVAGGLDSADSIARRIAQLLEQRDRRAHGVSITRSLR